MNPYFGVYYSPTSNSPQGQILHYGNVLQNGSRAMYGYLLPGWNGVTHGMGNVYPRSPQYNNFLPPSWNYYCYPQQHNPQEEGVKAIHVDNLLFDPNFQPNVETIIQDTEILLWELKDWLGDAFMDYYNFLKTYDPSDLHIAPPLTQQPSPPNTPLGYSRTNALGKAAKQPKQKYTTIATNPYPKVKPMRTNSPRKSPFLPTYPSPPLTPGARMLTPSPLIQVQVPGMPPYDAGVRPTAVNNNSFRPDILFS